MRRDIEQDVTKTKSYVDDDPFDLDAGKGGAALIAERGPCWLLLVVQGADARLVTLPPQAWNIRYVVVVALLSLGSWPLFLSLHSINKSSHQTTAIRICQNARV